MIENDQELKAMLERIKRFQRQVEMLCQVAPNPANYILSASGYLAEIDRMNSEINEYLWVHPTQKAELDRRRQRFEQGATTNRTWEKVKAKLK